MSDEPITHTDLTVVRLLNMMIERTKVPPNPTDAREAFVVAPAEWQWPHVLDPDPHGGKR